MQPKTTQIEFVFKQNIRKYILFQNHFILTTNQHVKTMHVIVFLLNLHCKHLNKYIYFFLLKKCIILRKSSLYIKLSMFV